MHDQTPTRRRLVFNECVRKMSFVKDKRIAEGTWLTEIENAMYCYIIALCFGDLTVQISYSDLPFPANGTPMSCSYEDKRELDHQACSEASSALYMLDDKMPATVNNRFVDSCYRLEEQLQEAATVLPGMVEIEFYAELYSASKIRRANELEARKQRREKQKVTKALRQPKKHTKTHKPSDKPEEQMADVIPLFPKRSAM